jgi:glycine/D-amino acid oxidase-like deaminating enzyme/nitrite reductase/ring-hydroxylating ferredoxin subunit
MDWLSANSYWHATAPSHKAEFFPRLTGNVETDVAVIGAGITGLTTALHLQAAGLRVAILEAGRVGAGTTGGTSGHLDALPDQGADTLIEQWGESAARLVTQGRLQAIDHIEAWTREFAIECEFQRIPACLFSESADGAGNLTEQRDAIRRLGVDIELVEATGLPWVSEGGVQVERQARMHSLKYLRGLARAFCRLGGVIFEQTRVRPPGANGRLLQTEQGTVTAERGSIVATHSAYLGLSQFDMRMAPYQSYVMSVRVAESLPDALYWDDAHPYHYLRRASTGDPHLLIVGGADHKTGQGGDERQPLRELEKYIKGRLTVEGIGHTWSAELFEPADGLPYVGQVPGADDLYIGTAYSGTGLTLGTLAGRLLANLLLERDDPLADVLTPARLKPLAGGRRLLAENLNVARRFLGDRITTASLKSFSDMATGTGRLVRYHGEPLAVFRDDNGQLHTLSPVCTHAGCFVQWNELERTWDCPCHGGRYSATGERLYGPPPQDLDVKVVEDS